MKSKKKNHKTKPPLFRLPDIINLSALHLHVTFLRYTFLFTFEDLHNPSIIKDKSE